MNRRKGVPCGCDADPCGCSPKNHCVKAISNVSPDPNGDFTIVAGNNVTITEVQNGIEITAAGGSAEDAVKSVNNVLPDAQGNVNVNVGVLTVNNQTPDAQGNVDVNGMEFVTQGNVNVYFTSVGRYIPQRITVTLPSSAEDMVSGYDYFVTASVLDDNFQSVTDVTISLPYGNLTTPTRTFTFDVNGGEDIVIYWALYRMKTTHTGLSKIFGALPSSVTDQEKLVSGTNIKTINAASLLGSGNINLQTPLTAGTDYQVPLVSGMNIKTINNESLLGSGDIQIGGGGGGSSNWTLYSSNDWNSLKASHYAVKDLLLIVKSNSMSGCQYVPKGSYVTYQVLHFTGNNKNTSSNIFYDCTEPMDDVLTSGSVGYDAMIYTTSGGATTVTSERYTLPKITTETTSPGIRLYVRD